MNKNKIDNELRQRIQGFISAGEFLGVITRAEAINLMDEAHFSVFGLTNQQRQARKADLKSVKNTQEQSIFDIPAIERLAKR